MFNKSLFNHHKLTIAAALLILFLWHLIFSSTAGAAPQSGVPQNPEAITAVPDVLVPSGVSSYDIASSKVFWHTNALCPPPVPASTTEEISEINAADDPVLIRRIPVYGGEERTLFEKNDPRPEGECNPYEIRSNVVSDGSFVYFADSSGLQKLSVNANPGDAPTLMTNQVISTYNDNKVELAVGSDAVYALTYHGSNNSKVWRVNKSTNFYLGVPISGSPHTLSYDGTDTYWLQSKQLKMITITDSTISSISTLASNVTGYFAEGFRTTCSNLICAFSRNVYYAQGKTVYGMNRYNNGNSTFGPIYISNAPQVDTFVYSMVTDKNNLYLLESRPVNVPPENFTNHKQTLVRTTRSASSTSGESLYENINTFFINTDHLQLNGTRLYWQEAEQVKHLPTDAEALQPINIDVTDVHVTQGIQDTSNGVFLVAGRTTYVRVLADTASGAASGVTALLYRVNPSTNNVIGEPILPVNQDGKYQTITTASSSMITDADFIFRLPESWLNGSPFKLRAVVNPWDYPTETTLSDNQMTTKTFSPVSSPRFEPEFYVFSYTKNGDHKEPRLVEDVIQTFSWLRRVYPLASAPGYWGDPSPGLRPSRRHVHLHELDELVDRTHSYCQLFAEEDRSSCASSYLNSWLRHRQELLKTDRVFYGLMAVNSPFNRGSGGGGVASGPAGTTCCGSGNWDTDGTFADWYTGHEIGHALGRKHPSKGNWCGHSNSDSSFPYAGASIGTFGTHFGFDVGDPYFDIDRQLLPAGVWNDLMSYCDNQWISDYTYGGFYAGMMAIAQSRPANVTAVPTLSLYGVIVPQSNTAVVHIANYQADGTPQTPDNTAVYAVHLLDQNNNVLSEFPFNPVEDEGDAEDVLQFAVTLPFNSSAKSYRIVFGSTVLLSESISTNAPVVSNVQVVNPAEPLIGEITLSWQASDADGDPLKFDVFANVDGGEFEPVVVGVDGMNTAVDTSTIAGGSVVFQVAASDGVFTGSANSVAYDVQAKAPEVLILSPGDGDEFQWGQPILFSADVYDLQDGMVSGPGSLVWYANGQTFGTGNTVETDDLPVGELEIQLVAKNSHGLTASHSITITIHDDLTLPQMQLAAAPGALGWNVDPNNVAPVTANLTVYNQGMGNLQWTASSSESWLTLSQTSGTNLAEIVVTVDVSGLDLEFGDTVLAQITVTSNSGTVNIPVYVTVGSLWLEETPMLLNHAIYLPMVVR